MAKYLTRIYPLYYLPEQLCDVFIKVLEYLQHLSHIPVSVPRLGGLCLLLARPEDARHVHGRKAAGGVEKYEAIGAVET